MNRTWNERRHHRNRIIKKRRDRYVNSYTYSGTWGYQPPKGPYVPLLGTLDKNNVTCSCYMCKGSRVKDERPEAKQKLRREIDEGLDTYEDLWYDELTT